MKRYYQIVMELQDDYGIWTAKRMAKKQVIKEMTADLKYHEWSLEEKVQRTADLIEVMDIEVE